MEHTRLDQKPRSRTPRASTTHSSSTRPLIAHMYDGRQAGRQSRSDPLGYSARMCGFGAAP
eukprot:12306665-Heterocapsa_arctica.AAC.1